VFLLLLLLFFFFFFFPLSPNSWVWTHASVGEALFLTPLGMLCVCCGQVPDKSDNRLLLSGFVVKAGECLCVVTKTGLNTEMGEAAALVHAASERDTQGIFEQKIMNVCEVVIFITLVVTAIIVFVQIYIRKQNFDMVILMALSLVIASVPVALPMVMQITMAIGARKV